MLKKQSSIDDSRYERVWNERVQVEAAEAEVYRVNFGIVPVSHRAYKYTIQPVQAIYIHCNISITIAIDVGFKGPRLHTQQVQWVSIESLLSW